METNHITLYLTDPYDSEYSSDQSEDDEDNNKIKPMEVDIDLGLSAFANATRYYSQKRHAAKKQEKTLKSQTVALKSAEKKTKQTLKEVFVGIFPHFMIYGVVQNSVYLNFLTRIQFNYHFIIYIPH